MKPGRPAHTSKDACLLANCNLLSPLYTYKVNSWFVDVYRETAPSWSGLSMDFTSAFKIGLPEIHADTFFSTSFTGIVSSTLASNRLEESSQNNQFNLKLARLLVVLAPGLQMFQGLYIYPLAPQYDARRNTTAPVVYSRAPVTCCKRPFQRLRSRAHS